MNDAMLQYNFNLVNLNTFGISVNAENYYRIDNFDQLKYLSTLPTPTFYLGGGSNVLFTNDYMGTVIHNCLKGVEKISEDSESVVVRVHAGEPWHAFVEYTLENQWFGLECLAYIPGNVGATPVQNIGAYGVEARDYIEKVHVYHPQENKHESYDNQACEFGYRDSAFKAQLNKYLVISVDFRLSKTPIEYKKYYPALHQYFFDHNIERPTAKDIFNAVISVRRSKLPEVGEIGSAGSFFKNPIVSKEHFEKLSIKFPNLISYEYDDRNVKLPAGQLIDLLGFKGDYKNDVGMYEKQALILVNLGNATGKNLHEHSLKVMRAVHDQFEVWLEPEVIIL